MSEHLPDTAVLDVQMPADYTDEGLRAAIAIRRDKDRVADVEESIEALTRVAVGGTALDPEVIT